MWPRMGSHYGQDVSGNLVGVEAGYQGVVMAILSNIFLLVSIYIQTCT
jgi:hypothetical protein